MFELSSILAPLDALSGNRVLAFAEYLAGVYKAKLHSMHVVAEIPSPMRQVLFPYAALGEDIGELEQELVRVAAEGLRKTFDSSRGNEGAPGHPNSVTYGPVVDGLLRAATRIGPDLLVIGAHGDRGPHSRHIGSTAARLLDGWGGPALVVRDRFNGRPFGRVAVATDFGAAAPPLMTAALGLAVRSGNPVTALTVLPDPRLLDPGQLLRGALRVDERALRTKGERNAQQQFKRLREAVEIPYPEREAVGQLEIDLQVRFGDPSDEIAAYVGEKDDTLLVVGRRGAPGEHTLALGRTAEQMVRRVPTHVLVLPVD